MAPSSFVPAVNEGTETYKGKLTLCCFHINYHNSYEKLMYYVVDI